MTPTQLFHALLHTLATQPESQYVDQLFADLAATGASQLHDTKAASLALACLHVTNPEALIAADLLLRQYGFALTAKRHGTGAHLISLKRHTTPAPHTASGTTRHQEGAHAA